MEEQLVKSQSFANIRMAQRSFERFYIVGGNSGIVTEQKIKHGKRSYVLKTESFALCDIDEVKWMMHRVDEFAEALHSWKDALEMYLALYNKEGSDEQENKKQKI